ncbi:DUF1376 domain-containing protein [uncultured Sulfitobacter sp.]|uniref:DUF1376 domain-containing protein n=1 Tax=uncultured Sulfitobacter sp. TaxID=191468 RepID=UPI002611F992|nr:DUF1376 domain-containing protein [uncultured Sulfitobacter sp.]
MSNLPYMKLWIADFIGDTTDLDAAETGAYIMLLMAQWKRQGDSLPNDQQKLKRMARCGRNWPKVWRSLERYFETDEAGIFNARLRLDAHLGVAKVKVNSRNGALGGAAKALKANNQGLANATVLLLQPPPEPESERHLAEEALILSAVAAGFDKARLDDPARFAADTHYMDHRLVVNELGLSDRTVLDVMKTVRSGKKDGPVSSFKYFEQALRRRADNVLKFENLEMLEADYAAE